MRLAWNPSPLGTERMGVLAHRDTRALLGSSRRNLQPRSNTASKHRPIPQRMYRVGTVLYTGIVVAFASAGSLAVLVLLLSPT